MFLSYGRNYWDRIEKVVSLVDSNSSVVDICCGPSVLYKPLSKKNVSYFGLDLNEHFVNRARKQGINSMTFNLLSEQIPSNQFDYVILQSSLYQFIPNHLEVIHRMLQATKKYVVISEPIINLVDNVPGWISAIVKKLKDPGNGPPQHSFTDKTLTEALACFSENVLQTLYIQGGMEKIYLLRKSSWVESPHTL